VISIAPAEQFAMYFPTAEELREYIPAVRNGALSVLLGHGVAPILRCVVRFESFAIHEIDSCYAAFFKASKEATERLLGLSPGHALNIKW
jgi:hypothetical protein